MRKDAVAMFFHNSSYLRRSKIFNNKECYIISYETDLDGLCAVVSDPLQLENDFLFYEFVRVVDSSRFGEYTQSGQVISVRDQQGRPGRYTLSAYLNDETPIAGGREPWGFPKKLVTPTLSVDGNDKLPGTLDYGPITKIRT